MTTDNQQPITWADLSAGEQDALRNANNNGGIFMQSLVDKGLLTVLADGGMWKQCEYTDLGRRVLASSTPDTGSGKPEETRARINVGRYAGHVGLVLTTRGELTNVQLGDGREGRYHSDEITIISTPAAESPTAGEAIGAKDDEWAVRDNKHQTALATIRDSVDMNSPIHNVVSQINFIEKELITLLNDSFVLNVDIQKELDNIWDAVRPDPESWDYPMQITRYVRYQADELATLRSQLAAAHEATAEAVRDNGRLRAAMKESLAYCRTFTQSDANAHMSRVKWLDMMRNYAARELASALAPTDAANPNAGSE